MPVLDPRTQEIITNMTPGSVQVGLGALMEQALSGVLPPGSVSLAEIAQGAAGQLIVGQGASALLFKTMSGDATLTSAGALTLGSILHTFTVGVDDTGYDVTFFGATSGKSWLWDESADSVVLAGNEGITGNLTVTGNFVNNLTTSTFADFISADAGALGPVVRLFHNSASPQGTDVMGRVLFQGNDTLAARRDYAAVEGVITNVAAANPEGDLVLKAANAGTLTEMVRLVGTSSTVNFPVNVTGGKLDITRTLASQTLENTTETIGLTSDSTFLTGTNVTYSGGRGSSALKLTSTWSAATGGYHGLYSLVTASGALNDANGGVVNIKGVTVTDAALTTGNVYGGQFIAKHSHATNKAANACPFIGVEGVVTQGTAGQIGTAIGVSAAYHIPADAAVYDGGAVYRGIQVTCDNASGNNPSEQSGVVVWNMAGAQDNVFKVVTSGTGFTNGINLGGATITNDILFSNSNIVFSGTAVTRAAVRADVGDTPPIGSIYVSTSAVGTTKPNLYVKILNGPGDTDWERLVSQASD